ncbi:hypothetical protein BURMUCF2_2553 [Burkholderia multivorans CF2]|nr:hypothetical protein BURMUCF2_2553 [Burkholderia multivorans CF2]
MPPVRPWLDWLLASGPVSTIVAKRQCMEQSLRPATVRMVRVERRPDRKILA